MATTINETVSRAFRAAFESHPARETDPAMALQSSREIASALVPAGVTGRFDDAALSFTETPATITINLTDDGMGPDATRADAEAYRDFVERRLAEIYASADITVTLLPTGEVTARTVAVDETEAQDVGDVMQTLWGEFCDDDALWPSAR